MKIYQKKKTIKPEISFSTSHRINFNRNHKNTVKAVIIIFFMIFILDKSIPADNKNTNDSRILTYDEYIETIRNKLPEMKNLNNSLKKAENNIYSAKSLHDIQFSSSFGGIGKKDYSQNYS